MGEMTIGLVIAVIVVIVVALIAMRWRSASGEQQALRHYQNALDTLRTVSDRMESSRPAVVPRSQSDPRPAEPPARKPVSAWASDPRASSDNSVSSGQRPRSVASQNPPSSVDDRESDGLAALHRV